MLTTALFVTPETYPLYVEAVNTPDEIVWSLDDMNNKFVVKYTIAENLWMTTNFAEESFHRNFPNNRTFPADRFFEVK